MSDRPPSTIMYGTSNMVPETGLKIKIPSLATRRAACTHMTMERLYGSHECDVCRRPSLFGWVYICTQDAHPFPDPGPVENQCNATSDNANSKNAAQEKWPFDLEPDYRMPTLELAPGVEKAIKDNQYSPEQEQMLRAQKRQVVELANATIEQFKREARSKDTSRRPSLARSKMGYESEIDSARQRDCSSTPKLRMFPYCKFQACHFCRPTYRDRAWQKFDEVYAKDASRVIESENCIFYETRPLISRKIMQDIGRGALARAPLSPCEFGSPTYSKQRKHSPNLEDPVSVDQQASMTEMFRPVDAVTLEPKDITDIDPQYEAEVRGFRENMRRRFMKGLSGRESPLSSKKRRLNWEPKTSLDTAFWKALDETLLQEATAVPLPEQDIADGHATKVNEVENRDLENGRVEMKSGLV